MEFVFYCPINFFYSSSYNFLFKNVLTHNSAFLILKWTHNEHNLNLPEFVIIFMFASYFLMR